MYATDFTKDVLDTSRTPEKCFFSDGGLSSNFPIHFFDSALPRRPTFGIDLGVTEMDATSPNKRVVFPNDNSQTLLSAWHPLSNNPGFGTIVDFLAALLDSAKSWSYDTLSHMPGFRGRIGTVLLRDDEGGLHLTMKPAIIGQLTTYGTQAGLEFIRRFGNPEFARGRQQETLMNWENHQSIRLRILLATMTEYTATMAESAKKLRPTTANYERFFTGHYGSTSSQLNGLGNLGVDPYTGLRETQAGLAKEIYDQLIALSTEITDTKAEHQHPPQIVDPAVGAPRPPPELKARPRI